MHVSSSPPSEPGSPAVEQELERLTDPTVLQERLSHALHRRSDQYLAVGVAYRNRAGCAAMGQRRFSETPGAGAVMLTGCITKLFTATLVLDAARDGHFGFDDPAGELLASAHAAARSALSGISVRHLLEHRHGLDDSRLGAVPLSADGYLDSDALCMRLGAAGKLADPGSLYSYGDAGPWLAAAILERVYGRSYRDLLSERLLRPLGMNAQLPQTVCPSTGGGLAVCVEGMLQFLLQNGRRCADLLTHVAGLPGWSSQERGITLGWKHYGSGWLGHNSALAGAAGSVRVHPEQGIAIAVTSADHALTNIIARLFGSTLPVLAGLRVPRALSSAEAAALDLQPWVGTYGNDALSIHITHCEAGALQLQAFHRPEAIPAAPFVTATLLPARENVFYTLPANTELFPFVQFVQVRSDRHPYLWNGRCVWPRMQ